jgi:hypothetical protein
MFARLLCRITSYKLWQQLKRGVMEVTKEPSAFLHFCAVLFGSRKLLITFLIAAPVLVLFLAVIAIFEMPLRGSGSGVALFPTSVAVLGLGLNLEALIRFALILLVGILLYVPIAWLFQFSRLSNLVLLRDDEENANAASEARAEFLGWLTAISIPYLILGFSMAIEFNSLIESPATGVGAIAAIMVLYALSVLSSFLYIEIRDLRRGFSKEMRSTGEWLKYSFELANYQTPIGTPAQNVSVLLKKWIELLDRSMGTNSDRHKLREILLGTLLTSYIKEESENIGGTLSSDRTPIWVSEVKRAAESMGDTGSVAFIATNVGFYAQYLATAVKGLIHEIPKDECVVLATTTYVLPSFWWNWPYASEHHGIYEPVEKFRKTLIDLAEEDAANGRSLRVFRRMLVRRDGNPDLSTDTRLSDKTLSDVFLSTFCSKDDWERMKRWRVIKDSRGQPLTSRDRSPVNESQLAESIRWTRADSRSKGQEESQVYWMCNELPSSGIISEPLVSYYNRAMHPSGGASEICEIDFDTFKSKFSLGPIEESGGLNGCPEITFIGTCKRGCEDVWRSSPELGLAFLSNMTKAHDSMFLAVVVTETLVNQLWKSVCKTLNERVIDDLLEDDDPA